MIEDRLNHRPRKRLGFKTPHQVFHEWACKLFCVNAGGVVIGDRVGDHQIQS
jgi:hypothetical protein